MVDFGTGRGFYSVGLGISDSGIVVGEGIVAGATFNRGFVDLSRGPVELPALHGQWSTAFDVNGGGVIVGYERYHDNVDWVERPIVWFRP